MKKWIMKTLTQLLKHKMKRDIKLFNLRGVDMAHGRKERRTTRRHERMHKVVMEEPLVYLFSFSKHLQDLPLLPHLFDLLQSPEPLSKQCNRRASCYCFIVLPFHESIN